MSKSDDLNLARLQGMDYALRQIEKNGIEDFRKELQWRFKRKIGVNISAREMNEASDRIKAWAYESVVTLALLTLRDEFDFGRKRLDRFNQRINEKSACLNENFATWDDYKKILKDETGIDVELIWMR